MVRSELVERVVKKRPHITKEDAQGILVDAFALISDCLTNLEVVKIRDFGSFYPKMQKPRKARNRVTGVLVMTRPHLRTYFRMSLAFRKSALSAQAKQIQETQQ